MIEGEKLRLTVDWCGKLQLTYLQVQTLQKPWAKYQSELDTDRLTTQPWMTKKKTWFTMF